MAKPAAPRASSSASTAGRTSTRKKSSTSSASLVNDASLANSAPVTKGASAALQPELSELASEPSHEQIAARAYGLWLSRGAHDGDAFGDWLRAEHELRTQN